ncbi:hypothetical protein G6011_07832 [Alternaria panax]|uniref:Uncharacterized protein n=1 Tax=Alternaria panax TaxID=48097 RepID=A0AAD4F8H1_9PLEO|nr:hypothetical protein G6011_07832 [Alternaria panax]
MALRRAGRFIWSDTPFVNFFTLIYVAVVLKGSSAKIVLRDYVVFRTIAILELAFMKAKIAAASVDVQQTMLERLLNSEFVMVRGKAFSAPFTAPPLLDRDRIISFSSSQRLSVMLYKTSIGHADGSLCGSSGPVAIAVPKNVGFVIDEAEERGWRIYRVSPTLLVIENCVQVMITKLRERAPTKERRGLVSVFTRFKAWTHGVLLRRLGRRRVVWLSKANKRGLKGVCWKGNANLVTGLKESWLHSQQKFQRLNPEEDGDQYLSNAHPSSEKAPNSCSFSLSPYYSITVKYKAVHPPPKMTSNDISTTTTPFHTPPSPPRLTTPSQPHIHFGATPHRSAVPRFPSSYSHSNHSSYLSEKSQALGTQVTRQTSSSSSSAMQPAQNFADMLSQHQLKSMSDFDKEEEARLAKTHGERLRKVGSGIGKLVGRLTKAKSEGGTK